MISMRGSRNFHERGSNENGNFGHRRGGVQPPPPPKKKKSRIYLFLGKIFKFRGGGPDPRSPLWIRACGRFLSTKTSEIRKQRRIQNALEAPINQNFLGGDPQPPLREGGTPLSCSPLSCRGTRSCFRRTTF